MSSWSSVGSVDQVAIASLEVGLAVGPCVVLEMDFKRAVTMVVPLRASLLATLARQYTNIDRSCERA